MLDSIAAMGPLPASPAKNHEQIKGAAQQFESLMIAELLKSARPDSDSSSWLGAGEDDQTGQSAIDYAQQQLASVMAKSGGIGLSKFIEGSLEKP